MSRARPAAGSFWPTRTQVELLRTALWQGEAAGEAWRRVRPSLDLDVMEPGTIVLTPLLYRQLVALAIDDPDLQRLKGLYRRAWYENQLLVEQLDRQQRALSQAGVEALVPAGLPLVQRFYGDLGLRRVASLELLVRERDASAAAAALKGIGMLELPRDRNADAPRAFRSGRGHVCFLHVRAPRDLLSATADGAAELWRSALPVELGTTVCLAPAATEELLYTCLSGAKPAREHRIDWILDAATIVTAGAGEIDWERLLAGAAERRMSLRLRDVLGFLRRELAAPVPEQVLAELERRPAARTERLAHRLSAGSRGVLGGLPDTVATHLRLSGERGLLPALATLPGFLQRVWGLEHAWQIAPRAGRKLGARAAATLARLVRRPPRQHPHAHPARRPRPASEQAESPTGSASTHA